MNGLSLVLHILVIVSISLIFLWCIIIIVSFWLKNSLKIAICWLIFKLVLSLWFMNPVVLIVILVATSTLFVAGLLSLSVSSVYLIVIIELFVIASAPLIIFWCLVLLVRSLVRLVVGIVIGRLHSLFLLVVLVLVHMPSSVASASLSWHNFVLSILIFTLVFFVIWSSLFIFVVLFVTRFNVVFIWSLHFLIISVIRTNLRLRSTHLTGLLWLLSPSSSSS